MMRSIGAELHRHRFPADRHNAAGRWRGASLRIPLLDEVRHGQAPSEATFYQIPHAVPLYEDLCRVQGAATCVHFNWL